MKYADYYIYNRRTGICHHPGCFWVKEMNYENTEKRYIKDDEKLPIPCPECKPNINPCNKPLPMRKL